MYLMTEVKCQPHSGHFSQQLGFMIMHVYVSFLQTKKTKQKTVVPTHKAKRFAMTIMRAQTFPTEL